MRRTSVWSAAVCALLITSAASAALRYHQVRVADLGTTKWTHVEVTAIIDRSETEDDGDWHLTIREDAAVCWQQGKLRRGCAVAEVHPEDHARLGGTRPKRGLFVRLRGDVRCDRGHGGFVKDGSRLRCTWPELHPVRELLVLNR